MLLNGSVADSSLTGDSSPQNSQFPLSNEITVSSGPEGAQAPGIAWCPDAPFSFFLFRLTCHLKNMLKNSLITLSANVEARFYDFRKGLALL